MNIFDGLFGYEVVMLILGSVLFLLLAFLLAWLIMKKRSYKQTLVFFIVSILMIGFPGIQKITYEQGKLKLEKITREINTDNKEEINGLKKRIDVLEPRISSDPEGLVAIARANLVIGDTMKAMTAVTQALKIDTGFVSAREMENKIVK